VEATSQQQFTVRLAVVAGEGVLHPLKNSTGSKNGIKNLKKFTQNFFVNKNFWKFFENFRIIFKDVSPLQHPFMSRHWHLVKPINTHGYNTVPELKKLWKKKKKIFQKWLMLISKITLILKTQAVMGYFKIIPLIFLCKFFYYITPLALETKNIHM
jgi:hypothetical protein